jgi:Xaa-Pro dipeptidase
MTADTLAPGSAAGAAPGFVPRLPAAVLDRLQDGVRVRADLAGLDAVLTDDPDDVAYLTGFFHHPCERPVAALVETSGRTVLLVPELELQHAQEQGARAELVSYPEYPGLESPFAALARVAGSQGPGRRVGLTTSMTQHRLALAGRAFGDDVTWVPTELVTHARYVKAPEEIALHREAARITDLMLEAGIALVTDAIASGGPLPSEQELAAHVTRTGTGLMYAQHADVVVVSPLAGGLVYAGPNSAIPHGLPSGYRLRPGDTFMLSLGCAVGGRFVEGERTFVLGEPTADQRGTRWPRGPARSPPACAAPTATPAAWTSSATAGSGSTCATARATGSGWACTSRRGWRTATPPSSSRGWWSPTSPGSTCPGTPATGSATACWSPRPAPSR